MPTKLEFKGAGAKKIARQLMQIETGEQPTLGQSFTFQDQVELTYLKGFDQNLTPFDAVTFILMSALSVGLSVLANFIYDDLTADNSTKLFIDGQEIPIDEQAIKEALLKSLQPKEDEAEEDRS